MTTHSLLELNCMTNFFLYFLFHFNFFVFLDVLNDKRKIIEWLYLFINRELLGQKKRNEKKLQETTTEWEEWERENKKKKTRKKAYVQWMNVYVWKWKYISKSHVKNRPLSERKLRENFYSVYISLLSAATEFSLKKLFQLIVNVAFVTDRRVK